MIQLPKLYDQSPVLIEQTFTVNTKTKKIALLHTNDAEQVIGTLQANISVETLALPASIEKIRAFITAQKIGTHVFVEAEWDLASDIFDVCMQEGLLEAEVQFLIAGDKKRFVYCMKCYGRNEVSLEAEQSVCSCGIHLEIGPFYSVIRQGYIGYPFQPITEQKGDDVYASSGSN